MKTKNLIPVMIVITTAVSAISTLAKASDSPVVSQSTAEETSNRQSNRFGAYLSILGDPNPTLMGINAAYNVTDYLRANVGFGHVSATLGDASASLTTIGVGAKAMVPGWSFTPVAGLGVSYAMFSGTTDVGGLSQSGINPYLTLGFDWQAKSGLNAGIGMNIALGGATSAPYINFGWFFD